MVTHRGLDLKADTQQIETQWLVEPTVLLFYFCTFLYNATQVKLMLSTVLYFNFLYLAMPNAANKLVRSYLLQQA